MAKMEKAPNTCDQGKANMQGSVKHESMPHPAMMPDNMKGPGHLSAKDMPMYRKPASGK